MNDALDSIVKSLQRGGLKEPTPKDLRTPYWDEEWKKVKEVLEAVEKNDGYGDELSYGIERLREKWEISKGWLLAVMDDDGRLETELSVEEILDQISCDVELRIKIEESIRETIHHIVGTLFKDFKYQHIYRRHMISAVINGIEKVVRKVTVSELVTNKLATWRSHPTDSKRQLGIGTKATKYMKLELESEGYEKEFVDFCNIVISQVISSLKSGGSSSIKVVLSVHPMDMIMMSESTSGWRSCHTLSDGDYRTAGVSMLLDKVTTIAYAYTNKKTVEIYRYKIPDSPIKIWRQLYFLDGKNFSALMGRQYPVDKPIFGEAIRKLIGHKVFGPILGIEKPKWSINNNYYNQEDGDTRHAVISTGDWHHQDTIKGRMRMKDPRSDAPQIRIGEEIFCLSCARERYGGGCTASLRCSRCGGFDETCCNCDKYIRGEFYKNDNGDLYCQACYEELYAQCDDCGEDEFRSDMTEIGNGYWVCSGCLDNHYRMCDWCNNYEPKDEIVITKENSYYCDSCLSDKAVQCSGCDCYTENWEKLKNDPNGYACEDCAKQCDECGEIFLEDELEDDLCSECRLELEEVV